jgi:hypothetical protein
MRPTSREVMTDMYRTSLVASIAALVLFAYAQARGMDPMNLLSGGHTPSPHSGGRSIYHK